MIKNELASYIKFISLCLLWYLSSALSSNTGKVILNNYRLPVTLTFYQFGFIAIFTFITTRKPFQLTKLRPLTKSILYNVSPMAFFQIGGHVFTSMAISRVPVSTVHTIKVSGVYYVKLFKLMVHKGPFTFVYCHLLRCII